MVAQGLVPTRARAHFCISQCHSTFFEGFTSVVVALGFLWFLCFSFAGAMWTRVCKRARAGEPIYSSGGERSRASGALLSDPRVPGALFLSCGCVTPAADRRSQHPFTPTGIVWGLH